MRETEHEQSTRSSSVNCERLTLAHVGTAADLACMLYLRLGRDPPAEVQCAIFLKVGGIGDDLIEDLGQTLMFQDSVDVDGVGVGEEEEGGLRGRGSLEVLHSSPHAGVLNNIANGAHAVSEWSAISYDGRDQLTKGMRRMAALISSSVLPSTS